MSLFSKFVRFDRDESGNATIEFVFVVPVFLLIFVSIFELGMATVRLTMLEHGLDVAMRDVRLGTGVTFSQEDIRDRICDAGTVLKDCQENLAVEMVVVDTDTFVMPTTSATCLDQSTGAADPVDQTTGLLADREQNDLMFIRACYVVDPLYPTFGLGAILETDEAGNMYLVAKSAFAQEPL